MYLYGERDRRRERETSDKFAVDVCMYVCMSVCTYMERDRRREGERETGGGRERPPTNLPLMNTRGTDRPPVISSIMSCGAGCEV